MLDFPNSPTPGQKYLNPDGVAWRWDGEKWTSVPGASVPGPPVTVTFVLSGKPGTGAIANAPMAMGVSVPAALAGSVVFDSTKATSNAGFVLNRISGGSTIAAIGTVTITPATNVSANFTGPGGTLAVGDVLQLVAPTQDASLSDVGITLLCSRI